MVINIKLKSLSDKTIALIVLSVFLVYILVLLKFIGPAYLVKKQRLAEIIITLHLLCFFGFFMFFPRKKTVIKGIVLCAIIPLICCMLLYTTFHVVCIVDWKSPFIDSDLFYLIAMFGLASYINLGAWVVSLPLLVVFGVYIYLSRQHIDSLVPERVGVFAQKKNILFMGIVYIVFAIMYAFILKVKWGAYHKQIFEHGAFIYIFSFLSIFYAIPFIKDNLKKSFLYCLVIPVFWPIFVGVIYTILALVFTLEMPNTSLSYSGMPFFRAEIFTFHYFLVRYLDTQSWFISLPLLMVCYIYARWFVSSKRLISEDGAT